MKYKDRQGNEYGGVSKQDSFFETAYKSAVGRTLLKFLSLPVFSKCGRVLMNSSLSKRAVPWFIGKAGINMSDYEETEYTSFNDFFTRRVKPEKRYFTKDDYFLCSPCDGKVSAYEITNSNSFVIKNSVYNTESLLRDKKLAKRFLGGYALIIRLSVENYHRYCYPANGVKSHNRKIDGYLNTVNPVVNGYVPVYKENSREYCLIKTDNFGDIIQMEVGALLVGKITNRDEGVCKVSRGEEKGYFEFGGSTIVLLLEKGKVDLSQDLIKNTLDGFETEVFQGDVLGISNKI